MGRYRGEWVDTGMRTGPTIAAVAIMCVLPALTATATATATPPSGVTAETLFQTELAGAEFTVRRIVIAPGGTTGWHYHDGPVYAYVESGTLTRVMHDCATDVTGAGGFVVEDVGSDHPHEGINASSGPLVLFAAYVEPPGDPYAEDAADPGCRDAGFA